MSHKRECPSDTGSVSPLPLFLGQAGWVRGDGESLTHPSCVVCTPPRMVKNEYAGGGPAHTLDPLCPWW